MDNHFTGYRGAKAAEIAQRCANAEVKECPKDDYGRPICRADSPMWGEVWKACPKGGQAK